MLVNVDKSPCHPLYMRLARQGTPSRRSPLHPLSSLSNMIIVDALKLTKSRKRCKYDLATIDTDIVDFGKSDFATTDTDTDTDTIKVHIIKYLPPSF